MKLYRYCIVIEDTGEREYYLGYCQAENAEKAFKNLQNYHCCNSCRVITSIRLLESKLDDEYGIFEEEDC